MIMCMIEYNVTVWWLYDRYTRCFCFSLL